MSTDTAAEALADEVRTLQALNQIGLVVASELDLQRAVQKVTEAATALVGAAFGAFFYNVRGEQGEAYELYSLCGAPREDFAHFPKPRNTALFGPTFRGESCVRSDDITQDPRYGLNAPHRGMPRGHLPVRSYLAVPVISRAGEVLGTMFFGHREAGVFDERSERQAVSIAAHAAIAIDNARLYEAAQLQIKERARIEVALHEADRRKDEFLAVLAHELRNPLAPLRSGLEIIRQLTRDNGATLLRTTEMMGRQIGHLVRLVDDLLDLSRVTHGRLELRREPLLLREVAEAAIEGSRTLIDARGHELIFQCLDDRLAVDGDAHRLAQVVANLLSNSAKYTPPGGRITLTVERIGNEALISVTDTGIGIPTESLSRIFEMFSQIRSDGNQSEGGLGIGLALVQHLVQLHGGTVSATSHGAGEGSEFVVRLPALAFVDWRDESPHVVGPEVLANVMSRRVLVADDNTDAADMWLQLAGHSVRTAADGEQVVEVAERFRPDVIFMDLGMPRLDGLAASRKIRSQPWGRGIRIVALTGWGREEDRLRTQAAGIDLHWVKPVDPHALMRILALEPATARPCAP
jgi:signal transduction histidine kinase/ActR/RegA family two-component response regulator